MRRRLPALVFLVVGALLLMTAGVLAFSYYSAVKPVSVPKVTVPMQVVTVKPETVTGTPTHITIASVGIDQPVDRGEYDAKTGQWTLSYHAAYWGSMTAPVNSQTGNTFIYGHDVPEIFGNLNTAQMGAKAVVTTDNGYQFTYTLKEAAEVDPTDVSRLQPTSAPTLTVQTCSGTWYQYRHLFTFTLDGYKKV